MNFIAYIPSHKRGERERAVIIMYKPVSMGPVVTNNMGFRTNKMARIKGWICGPGRADSCPVGERLVGTCCHVASVLYMAGVLPANPGLFTSRHRNMHVVDRANIGGMDEDILSEVAN